MPAAKALDHVTRWHSAVARAVNLALPDTDDKSSIASEAASAADGSSTPGVAADAADDGARPSILEMAAAVEAAIFASQPALPPVLPSSAASASASSAAPASAAAPAQCARCTTGGAGGPAAAAAPTPAVGAFPVAASSSSSCSSPAAPVVASDVDGLRLQAGAAGSVHLSQAIVLGAAGIIAGLCLRDVLDGWLRRSK